ncbi:MAG: restriction endonuclease subunit S [Bacteroidales bacterium]|nr:restriction endonuclease subunit S [Bacteroidales bacterium]
MKHDWENKKLGEVASLVADGDWIESKDQSEDGIRLIQTGNIGNGVFKSKDDKPHYISEETFNRLGCTEIFEGDCLVSRLPDPVGRACIIPNTDSRMITAVDCSIIRFDKSYLPKTFVYYSRSSKYATLISNNTTGSTRKRISRKNLETIPIPVPPLPIQQQIVAELDKVSEIIEKKKQQVKELDTLAQSIFYDMFGDPDAIFEKWGQMDLIDVCDKIVDCPHTTPIKAGVPTPYPCIRTSELKGGIIHWDSMQYVFEEEYQKRVSRLIPKAGDIIYGREGSFGDAVILPEGWQFCLGQRTMLFRANNSIVNNSYLHRALISEVVLSQAKDKNVASTVAHVNVKDIKRFKIPIPPLPLQQSFAQKVEAIERQKELITASIKEAQLLFDARMDYWFGE